MKAKTRKLIVFLIMLNTSGEVLARSWRVAQIPNGNSFGCRTCHNASYSSLNSFGTDVLRIVGRGGRDRFWSQTLASKDSDGDGVPNGQELGDEDGDGFSTIESSGVTNPGDSDSKPENTVPTADAGVPQSVSEGSLVTLFGGGSRDVDLDDLSYKWTAPQGINLSSITAKSPSFIAPKVGEDTDYTFMLVVNDGQYDSLVSTTVVTVKDVNKPPIADAGAKQSVNEGALVTLDASGSRDEDFDELSFTWTAPEGIELSSTSVTYPTFTAPPVDKNTILTFGLLVNDGKADSAISFVEITVNNSEVEPVYINITNRQDGPRMNYMSFDFKTTDRMMYEIQASVNLKDWEKVQIIIGNGKTTRFTDEKSPDFKRRFYRIVVDH